MNPPTPVDPASQAPDASQHDLLGRAASDHQAGRLAQARSLYEEVLRAHPDNPIANHNLGALFMQSGMPVAAALPYFRAAWEADPSHFAHGLSYLRALVVSGDLAQARRLHAECASRGLRWPSIASLQESLKPRPGAPPRAPQAAPAAAGRLSQAQFKELRAGARPQQIAD